MSIHVYCVVVVRAWTYEYGCYGVLRLLSRVLVAQEPLLKDHCNIRSDNHKYRRNTLNTLFRPRITFLCQDVRDTLMSRFSALAWPPF
jgi:hypothetical protein